MSKDSLGFTETMTLRAHCWNVSVDLHGNAMAEFRSESELSSFWLLIPAVAVEQMISTVRLEADITFTARRDAEGHIATGELLEWNWPARGDPGEAWRKWWSEHMSHWDDVEDVDAELRGEGKT